MKDWIIERSMDANATAYWQYIFVKHENKLADHYGIKTNPRTPSGWKILSEEDAIKSLDPLT